MDNLCWIIFATHLRRKCPGAQKPAGLSPGGQFVPMLADRISENTIAHFSLLPLAVVRYVNPGSHDPALIFFKSERRKIECINSIAYINEKGASIFSTYIRSEISIWIF
jgi:hypothetical protein